MQQPFGVGAVITTDVELVEHHGARIRARVERRLLRIGFGNRTGFRITFGRARPISLHLARGQRTEIIPIPRDPPLHATARLLILAAFSLALPALAPSTGPRKLLPTNDGESDGTD